MNRVLVVTPRPDERDRLALCARRAGYSVRSTGETSEAPGLAREWHPHIVIAPLDAHAADGAPLLSALRALPACDSMGIIALLPPGQRDLRPALLAGADDALPAPVGEPALLEAIAARLARTRPATPSSPHVATPALDDLLRPLGACTRPVTVALVGLLDTAAIAAAAGCSAAQQVEALWAQRVHALAQDALVATPIGPGEVLVVLPPSTPQIRAVLAALAGTGQIPVEVDGRTYRTRGAVGVVTLRRDEHSAGAPCPVPDSASLLARCRFALERARSQSHPRVHAFDDAEAHGVVDDLALAAHIQHAAQHGRFQLVYLPKVSLPAGEVLGVEALIRWSMPSGEAVPPARLLAVADQAGLLDEVGTWALREACRQAAKWTEAGLRLPVSVNIAAAQFRRGDLVDETRLALSEAGLQGEQLTIEVSERTVATTGDEVREQLADIRVSGVRVSIEDVGAGALALPLLRGLPMDELKADQSLVERLPGTGQDRAAADLVLREARAADVPCVAEGVENAAQWAYLAEQGWAAAQGWLVSRPLPPRSVPEYCTRMAASQQAAMDG